MALSTNQIVGLIISFIMLAILLPLGINDLLAFTSSNSSIQTIVSTVIPIVGVIGLLMAFIPKKQ